MRKNIIERYSDFLPMDKLSTVVSIGECDTPLIKLNRLCQHYNIESDIYVKFEGLNPTGSFKDRGMTVVVSAAVSAGSKVVVCASTGNTSAAAAAYAARAGIKCFVLIPKGNVALGKLAQALIYGAQVVELDGNFDQAYQCVYKITKESDELTLVNSINPFRLEGQKTASFEIVDELGFAPDFHVMPIGNAGNYTAYHLGFKEYFENGKSNKVPKMCGFQAEGASPIVQGKPFENPETVATAIRIGNPARWKEALAAKESTGGIIEAVTDQEILAAQASLASLEGLFVEPAAAAPIAGIIKKNQEGFFPKGSSITATFTGNGLKDPNVVVNKDWSTSRYKASNQQEFEDIISRCL